MKTLELSVMDARVAFCVKHNLTMYIRYKFTDKVIPNAYIGTSQPGFGNTFMDLELEYVHYLLRIVKDSTGVDTRIMDIGVFLDFRDNTARISVVEEVRVIHLKLKINHG